MKYNSESVQEVFKNLEKQLFWGSIKNYIIVLLIYTSIFCYLGLVFEGLSSISSLVRYFMGVR